MLEVKGFSAGYQGNDVVHEVAFQVDPNDLVELLLHDQVDRLEPALEVGTHGGHQDHEGELRGRLHGSPGCDHQHGWYQLLPGNCSCLYCTGIWY